MQRGRLRPSSGRAATADDTPPVKSLSTRHTLLAPTRPSAAAYDSRGGTPVAGEHIWAIARMMESRERLYKRRAAPALWFRL